MDGLSSIYVRELRPKGDEAILNNWIAVRARSSSIHREYKRAISLFVQPQPNSNVQIQEFNRDPLKHEDCIMAFHGLFFIGRSGWERSVIIETIRFHWTRIYLLLPLVLYY